MSSKRGAAKAATKKNGTLPGIPPGENAPISELVSNSNKGMKKMAKQNGQISQNSEVEALISGLQDVSEPEIAGWFQPAEGAEFVGNVIKVISIETDDGARDAVLVKLKAPCTSASVTGSDEVVTIDAGQVLAVGMRYSLQEILCYVEKRGLVYVKALNKTKLKGGRSKWNFVIRADTKAKTAPVAPTPRVATEGASDTGGF